MCPYSLPGEGVPQKSFAYRQCANQLMYKKFADQRKVYCWQICIIIRPRSLIRQISKQTNKKFADLRKKYVSGTYFLVFLSLGPTMGDKKRAPQGKKSVLLFGLYLCNHSSNFKIFKSLTQLVKWATQKYQQFQKFNTYSLA